MECLEAYHPSRGILNDISNTNSQCSVWISPTPIDTPGAPPPLHHVASPRDYTPERYPARVWNPPAMPTCVCVCGGAVVAGVGCARVVPPASSWLVIWVPDIVKSVCFPMVFATFQVTLPDDCPRRLPQIPNGTTAPAVVLHVQALSGFEVASLQRGGPRSLVPA